MQSENKSDFSETQLSNMKSAEIAKANQQQVMDAQPMDVNKPFRLGILVDESNYEDLLYYNSQFKEINELFGYKINLIFIGYKPENDRLNALDGVIFDYVQPVSLIHYFKQLTALEIDLLFVPLINEEGSKMKLYHETSEDTYIWREVSLLKVPILVSDISPYNTWLIKPDWDGFIYPNREEFIKYFIDFFEKKFPSIKAAGHYAHERAKNLYYHVGIGEQLMKLFTLEMG